MIFLDKETAVDFDTPNVVPLVSKLSDGVISLDWF